MKILIKVLNYFVQLFTKKNFLEMNIHPSAFVNFLNVKSNNQCVLKIGRDSQVHGSLFFERPNAEISIGEETFIGKSSLVSSTGIHIGNHVLISWGVSIVDHNSHSLVYSERAQDVLDWKQGKKDWQNVATKPVHIQNKAWIGFNTIILKGVTIHEGAIVGAGSVVTKDVAPWTIVAGNPAKLIREIPENER
jgi:acetyltransferase-like isoleucine patch superfamily enzyme